MIVYVYKSNVSQGVLSPMKKIAITTDSNSGILPDEYKDKGVFVLPMPFLIDNEQYFENVNLTQYGFYQLLTANANVSTSQPSYGELTDFWAEVLKEYDEIVHIPMSSGLSNSCETATRIAKEYDGKIHVVDNRRISVTLKQSVLDATVLRDSGMSAKDIQEYLEVTSADSSIYIAVDTMKYLKKGGRVTPAAATIATVLKIKPILSIRGAKLDKFAVARTPQKAKETMKQAMKKDMETTFAEFVENGEMVLYIAHTNAYEEAEKFAEEVRKDFPNIPVLFCDPLSLSVSCHIGPGSLALACARIAKI